MRKYSPRVAKALALYDRLIEATGVTRDALTEQVNDRVREFDPEEREAYYMGTVIIRRSRDLRLQDAARAHRG